MSKSTSKTKKGFFSKFLKFFMYILAAILLSSTLWVLYYKYQNPSQTGLMSLRKEQAEKTNKKLHIQYAWRDYDQLSTSLKKAVIIAEDTSFLAHHGFNFKAIRLAYQANRKLGTSKYGASSISQQTAKNLFLWNGKSWARKILEGYFTFLIEAIWDKKRILEMYLNIIEYGDGVFGAEAASQRYFKIPASKLSQSQASLLAVVLPSPRKWDLESPPRDLMIKAKVNAILVRMNKRFYQALPK